MRLSYRYLQCPAKGLRACRRSGRYRQVMFDGSKLLAILTRDNLVVRRRSLASRGRWTLPTMGFVLEPRRLLASVSYSVHEIPADRPDFVVLADLTGDLHLDLLTMSTDGGVVWQPNLGNGEFGTARTLAPDNRFGGGTMLAEDVNGDGDLDVVVSNRAGVRCYENLDGRGDFRASEAAMTDWDYNSFFLDLADVDADGDQDLLWAAFNDPRVMWLENVDGRGSFTRSHLIDANAYFATVSIQGADFDGDGDVDVVIGSADFGEYAWFQDEEDQWDGQYFGDNYASRLTTADVDLDGDLDLFSVSFSGRHGASWYENVSGLEGFQGHPISLEFHFPLDWFNSSIVDFDEDGDLDIVYFVDHHFGWLENTGAAAGFVEHQLLETEYAAFDLSMFFGIAAGDISGDGKPDLVLVIQDAQSVVWYRSEIPGDSSQDGRFDTTDFVQVFQAGKYGSDLRANFQEGDWNGDGFFDSGDFVFAFQAGNYEVATKSLGVEIAATVEAVFAESHRERVKTFAP